MRVLVVDDDDISRRVLAHLLSGLGIFDVVEADDGESAWEMLQGGLRPTVCFCDGRMPRLSGIGLLERITLQDFPRFPIIFVSANDDDESVVQAMRLGAVAYICKPFNVDQVRVELDKHCQHAWNHIAENPIASLKRLKLHAPQLLGYLQAFLVQLDEASVAFNTAFESGNFAAIQKRLDALHHGCLTLGLTYAGSLLAAMNTEIIEGDKLILCMSIVRKGVSYQIRVVKAMLVPVKS